jgi:hypothetical protein
MRDLLRALKVQRWDDHRYYHHSRINQSLHLLSACSFVCAYVLLFADPAAAGIVGWLVAMVSRQSGHFFFEPKGYDTVNRATHEHKEDIKVGYNLRRKIVLMAVWAAVPLVLYADPTLNNMLAEPANLAGFVHNVGLVWLALGIGGLLFRMVQLFILRDIATGIVWMIKILTDPFHDILLYWKSPLYLLRGELIDPMHELRAIIEESDEPREQAA